MPNTPLLHLPTLCLPEQFLAKLHLMDYSLLVGIHDKARAEEEAVQQETAARDGAGGGRETSESEECDSGERLASFLASPQLSS